MTHGTTDPLARRLDESLRETLLDLERLRQREARALRETTALRDVLSAITRRSTPQGALHGLLDSVCQTFGADAAAILLCQPGRDWTVAHATGPALVDAAAPVGLSGQGEAALLCLSKRPAAFTPACLQLLCRIADIAGGTLDKLALADRQALLAAVIEGSTASITIADAVHPEVPLIYVNPAFEALTGYGRTEVLARNCRLLAADPPTPPSGSACARPLPTASAAGSCCSTAARTDRPSGTNSTSTPCRGRARLRSIWWPPRWT